MIIASKAFKTWFDLYEDTQALLVTAETNSVARRLVLESAQNGFTRGDGDCLSVLVQF